MGRQLSFSRVEGINRRTVVRIPAWEKARRLATIIVASQDASLQSFELMWLLPDKQEPVIVMCKN